MKPLRGTTVLDFTHAYSGPLCTYLLAVAGADVIKVESPHGDEHRSRAIFDQLNAGKRSVVLDLKSTRGQEAARHLARHSNVVVENFRPGVAASLGVDAETLRAASRTLIYCSISGFGIEGDLSTRPAIEWTVQAATGISSLYLGADSDPMFNGLSLLDPFAGFYAYSAVLSALLERNRIGQGCVLDISMAEGGMVVQAARSFAALQETAEDATPPRPTMARFPTADGRQVFIAALHDKWFARLCEVIGASELATEHRFSSPPLRQKSAAVLYELIAARTATLTATTLLDRLEASGVPAELVSPFASFARDFLRDQRLTSRVRARDGELIEVFRPRLGAGAPDGGMEAPIAAPGLGEHTTSVLIEHGFTESEVESLIDAGAAGGARTSAR